MSEHNASFHSLRHTYASLSIMNGMPLMVVAKNLGHVDTRMGQRHYGHMAPSYVADAIRKTAPRFGIKASRKVVPTTGRISDRTGQWRWSSKCQGYQPTACCDVVRDIPLGGKCRRRP